MVRIQNIDPLKNKLDTVEIFRTKQNGNTLDMVGINRHYAINNKTEIVETGIQKLVNISG